MDIGIPDIDVWAVLQGIYAFAKANGMSAFNWILDWVGGNPIVAGLVIGFPIYIIADLIYHRFIDRPTAAFGDRLMNSVKNLVIFIGILIVVFVAWRGM